MLCYLHLLLNVNRVPTATFVRTFRMNIVFMSIVSGGRVLTVLGSSGARFSLMSRVVSRLGAAMRALVLGSFS